RALRVVIAGEILQLHPETGVVGELVQDGAGNGFLPQAGERLDVFAVGDGGIETIEGLAVFDQRAGAAEGGAAEVVAAVGEGKLLLRALARPFGNDIDHAAGAGLAVDRGGRPLDEFNPVDVDDIIKANAGETV